MGTNFWERMRTRARTWSVERKKDAVCPEGTWAIHLFSHIRSLEVRQGGPKRGARGKERGGAEGEEEERRETEKKEPGRRAGESQKRRRIILQARASKFSFSS